MRPQWYLSHEFGIKMSEKKDEREEKLINAARKGDLETVLVSTSDLSCTLVLKLDQWLFLLKFT